MKESAGKKPKKVLIIVENLPVPFDTRVWQEANALKEEGYKVSIICPIGKGYTERNEVINGISIYRHSLPMEGHGKIGFLVEYSIALLLEFMLSLKIFFKEGFDVIHACNPPDNIFLIGAFYKLFGKKFIFDHHDLNPELYFAKFGTKNFFYNLLLLFEWLTFQFADVSLATNESYKEIAIKRGGMNPEKVFVVRSGPNLKRLVIQPPNNEIKRNKEYMVGYLGVIGKQEGIDYLLEAAKYIREKKGRDDIFFGIVGGGTYLEEAKERCIQLGINDIVEFTDRVSDEKMLEYINTADVCVNPDEFNEMNDKSTKEATIIQNIVNAFDERFKYIYLKENKGAGGARNVGLRLAKGEYITLLDSDDKYHPKKLEVGVDFLNKNFDVDMSIHYFKFFPVYNHFMLEKPFKNMEDNKVTFLSFCPRFYHVCMMTRRSSLAKNNLYYDEDRLHDIGEDSKFLYECIKTLNIKYIDKILYYYRKHSENISFNNPEANKNNKLKKSAIARYKLILNDFKIDYSNEDLDLHFSMCMCQVPKSLDDFNKIDKWISKIVEHNKKIKFFPQKTVEMVLANYYFEFCSKSARKYGFASLLKFIVSCRLFKTDKNIFRWSVFIIKILQHYTFYRS